MHSLGANQRIVVSTDVLQRQDFYRHHTPRLNGVANGATKFDLTVCSFNMHNFGHRKPKSNIVKQMAEVLATTGADFVVLQEIQKSLVSGSFTHTGAAPYNPNDTTKLFHDTMCNSRFMLSQSMDATSTKDSLKMRPGLGSEFSALYFNPLKFAILGQGFIESAIIAQSSDALNGHNYMPYAWLCRPVDDPSTQPFLIVNVHLVPGEHKLQTIELLHIVNTLTKLGYNRYLIVGDCNFSDRDVLTVCLDQVEEKSTIRLTTLNEKDNTNAKRTKPFDHILVPRSFAPVSGSTWSTIEFVTVELREAWNKADKEAKKKIADEQKPTGFSDHCPVLCAATFARH